MAYQTLEELQAEHAELENKITSLAVYMTTQDFADDSESEKSDLMNQKAYMDITLYCLHSRIVRQSN